MKTKDKLIIYAFVAMLNGLALIVNAQQPVVIIDTIYSKVLSEPRVIKALLPPDFTINNKYDVLYVLDGEDFGTTAWQILSIAQAFEYAPPMIIISIHNKSIDSNHLSSRNRDFLPIAAEGYPHSGGSDNFLTFIKSELIPFVNHTYPSSGNNLLFGHSYGGLFALYTLFTQPDLFHSYIASDPSLWWNDGYVNKLAAANISKLTTNNSTLYFAGREGSLFKVLGPNTMDSLLKVKCPPGLKWKSEAYENERHQSVKIKTLYDGLKFIYFGYSPTNESSYVTNSLEFFPRDGILLKDKPAKIMTYTTFLDYEPGIRYTTDGSEPTPASSKFEFGIQITAPTELTLKLFSNYGNSPEVRGHFEMGESLPARPKPKFVVPGGFRFDYYKGNWNTMPDFSRLASQKSGQAKTYIRDYISDTSYFACKIEGYLEIAKDGYYTFFLQAEYQAMLYLGDKCIMNINLATDSLDNRSFIVPLMKGFYPIKLAYLHRNGQPSLRLSYVPPAEDELFVPGLPIPLKFQFGRK